MGAVSASATTAYRLAFGSLVYGAPTAGPLIIHGHRAATSDRMVADQIIRNADGSTTTRASMGQLIYEEYPGSHDHRHWHYKALRPLPTAVGLGPVGCPPGQQGGVLPVRRRLRAGQLRLPAPKALEVNEGLGPDRTDYYNPNLEGQWIEVQHVPPGDYWLVHWVNSAKRICESDYSNNAAAVKIALWPNGYGVAPYFTVKETVVPFPSLFSDLGPPTGCGGGSMPTPQLPDLVQRAPGELPSRRALTGRPRSRSASRGVTPCWR